MSIIRNSVEFDDLSDHDKKEVEDFKRYLRNEMTEDEKLKYEGLSSMIGGDNLGCKHKVIVKEEKQVKHTVYGRGLSEPIQDKVVEEDSFYYCDNCNVVIDFEEWKEGA